MGLSIDTAVNQLKAAADETRLRLLILLGAGERSVKELTEVLGQSQPRISRHLKILAEAGLVSRHPEGSWVYYRLSEGGFAHSALPQFAQLGTSALGQTDATVRRDLARLEALRRRNAEMAERFFATHAESWDEIRSLHVPEREVEAAILAAAGPGPFRAMLDIGTGTGRMLELLAPRCDRALGIDRSAAMLTVARANLERAGLAQARVRIGDSGDLNVAQGSFDLVVIHQVLHVLEEPARALAEAAGALAPAGRLLVVDFAPHDLEFLRQEQAHRRLGFAHDQVAGWLDEAGLELERTQDLASDGGSKLTVTIWSARDRRLAALPAAGRAAERAS